MSTKILIVDDHQPITKATSAIIDEMKLPNCKIIIAHQLDEAFSVIRSSAISPVDLLIIDLSYENATHSKTFINGDEFIKEIKNLSPETKIIVHSHIKSKERIAYLIRDLEIDAYVQKGGYSLDEIQHAVSLVLEGRCYFSPQLTRAGFAYSDQPFDRRNLLILHALSRGMTTEQIVDFLKHEGIKANSLRTVQQCITDMMVSLNAKTREEMVYIAKSEGLID